MDDRLWSTNTPVNQIYDYWQSPVCALRTMKSEVGCGVAEEKRALASSQDPNWMVSGNWALIQFYSPNNSTLSWSARTRETLTSLNNK
jgi:hypothetical protein